MIEQLQVRVGLLLTGPHYEILEDKCIHIRNGTIEAIESQATCASQSIGSASLIAVPPATISHSHSMDHAFPEYGVSLPLEDLVSPPNGLKHRLLAKLAFDDAVEKTLSYYTLAWKRGVGLILDYRERGGWGCLTAKKALEEAPPGLRVIVLGRPGEEWPKGCDGLGLNSPLDYDLETLRELASRFKPSSAHVAETREMREKGDLEAAIAAGLDFIVHGTHLNRGDLELLAQKNIGLVLCPSSNLWHGTGIPPVVEALEAVPLVGLGTDNAAWHAPDAWSEASLAYHLARLQGSRDREHARLLLRAVLEGGYLLSGVQPPYIVEGAPARIVFYDARDTGILEAEDKYSAVVKRLVLARLMARIDEGELAWL